MIYGPHGHVSRGLANPAVQRMVEMERAGASAEELLAGVGRTVLAADAWRATWRGDLPSGSGVGLVGEIVTVAELLDELMALARNRRSPSSRSSGPRLETAE